MLLQVIRWLLNDLGVPAVDLRWADPGLFPHDTRGLLAKALAAIDLEPCDVLFVHRDAEREALAVRVREIRDELNTVIGSSNTSYICVVPVRMSEAWFLFHEFSIRKAAGNPLGNAPLNLPSISRIESLPSPKTILHQALRGATNATGRRLKRFDRQLRRSALRVGEFIDDYSPLRLLPAFQAFESDVKAYLDRTSS